MQGKQSQQSYTPSPCLAQVLQADCRSYHECGGCMQWCCSAPGALCHVSVMRELQEEPGFSGRPLAHKVHAFSRTDFCLYWGVCEMKPGQKTPGTTASISAWVRENGIHSAYSYPGTPDCRSMNESGEMKPLSLQARGGPWSTFQKHKRWRSTAPPPAS